MIFSKKVDIIYTRVCPAIILADNLIAKLKVRIIYEKISMKIKKGIMKIGHCGIKVQKKSKPFFSKPNINIPKPKLRDKKTINSM
jgi:hypothetical protein